MAWTVDLDSAAADDVRRLGRAVQTRIVRFLRDRLASSEDPAKLGSPLKGKFAGLWRFRVGDYRLIASLDAARSVVLILQVGHRREIYRY